MKQILVLVLVLCCSGCATAVGASRRSDGPAEISAGPPRDDPAVW
jgi:hypothetical protein